MAFVCAHCGEQYDEIEPGFRRPDAYFAVPKDERADRIKESDDLVCIDELAHFIRCVAPIPVLGREQTYGWGFWVKVTKAHYEEYLRYFTDDPPAGHQGFAATLANQTRLVAPTLGRRVHVHLGRGKARPSLMLLDDEHELTVQQTAGVSAAVVHSWSEAISNRSAVPMAPPRKKPRLEVEGWLIARPEQVGRERHVLTDRPRRGDLAKVAFVFYAADAAGEVTERVEFMWVELQEIGGGGWWRGTLDNHPFVPGPIDAGSPVWLRAEDLAQRGRSGEVALALLIARRVEGHQARTRPAVSGCRKAHRARRRATPSPCVTTAANASPHRPPAW